MGRHTLCVKNHAKDTETEIQIGEFRVSFGG